MFDIVEAMQMTQDPVYYNDGSGTQALDSPRNSYAADYLIPKDVWVPNVSFKTPGGYREIPTHDGVAPKPNGGFKTIGGLGYGRGLLARDQSNVDLPATGWNLPPWGYGRNIRWNSGNSYRSPVQNYAVPSTNLGGLGCGCAPAVPLGCAGEDCGCGMGSLGAPWMPSGAARVAAQGLLNAIDAAVTAGNTVATFDALVGPADADIRQIQDPDEATFLTANVREMARNALSDLGGWATEPDEVAIMSARIGAARALAAKVADGSLTRFELEHSGMNPNQWDLFQSAGKNSLDQIRAEIARNQPSLLQKIYMSKVGDAVIVTGAFVTGATGLNEDALDQAYVEAGGRDRENVDVGREAGKKAASLLGFWGKVAVGAGVAGIGFYAYMKGRGSRK